MAFVTLYSERGASRNVVRDTSNVRSKSKRKLLCATDQTFSRGVLLPECPDTWTSAVDGPVVYINFERHCSWVLHNGASLISGPVRLNKSDSRNLQTKGLVLLLVVFSSRLTTIQRRHLELSREGHAYRSQCKIDQDPRAILKRVIIGLTERRTRKKGVPDLRLNLRWNRPCNLMPLDQPE